MKYKVTKYHHKEVWVKGDLAADTIIDSVNIFPTKKEVVKYLENICTNSSYNSYKKSLNVKTRGIMPSLTIFTGKTWINENTGSEEEEVYLYRTEKV